MPSTNPVAEAPRRRPGPALAPCVLIALLAGGCAASSVERAVLYDAPTESAAEAPASATWGATQAPGARFAEGLVSYSARSRDDLAAAEEPAGDSATTDADEPETAPPAEKPSKRLMVYNARLELLVANVEEARTAFLSAVERAGGYLSSRRGDSVTCRVPAARFDEVIESLRGAGTVIDESLEALDVTKQYRDLEIRLANAENGRSRLLELLERAEKVEDLLQIEAELRRLTEEIERLRGELTYLADRIALSTIEVVFRANAPPPESRPRNRYSRFGWINRVGIETVLRSF